MDNSSEPHQYEGPPPGTPCCVCTAAGHFCQADDWTAGEKRSGICFPCLEQRDCEQIIAHKRRAAAEEKLADAKVVWSTKETPAEQKPPEKHGSYKHRNRQLAANMLQEGYPLYEIMERSKLSKNTVLDVKRALGLPMLKIGVRNPEEKREVVKVAEKREIIINADPDSNKTISLKSGGTVTVSGSFNLFSLSSEDRKFVFDLIDKLENYA